MPCERLPFASPKVTSYSAKGRLLQRKRRPFGKHMIWLAEPEADETVENCSLAPLKRLQNGAQAAFTEATTHIRPQIIIMPATITPLTNNGTIIVKAGHRQNWTGYGKGVYGRTYKAIASNTITPLHQALTAVSKQQSEFSSCGLALTGTKLLFRITPGFIAWHQYKTKKTAAQQPAQARKIGIKRRNSEQNL